MTKTNIFTIIAVITSMLLMTSCKKKNNTPSQISTLEVKTYSNLHAPQSGGMGTPTSGAFVKFSFEKNTIVTDDKWDIAFRGNTIIVNGGDKIGLHEEPERMGKAAVSIVTNTLEGVTAVPEASTFKQDAPGTAAIPSGSGNGWYNYDPSNHLITPIAGRIFVVKTHNGAYAKVEIISYYKDAPANPTIETPSRYYTFKYVYQPNGTHF